MRLVGGIALSFALLGQVTLGFENKKFGYGKQRLQNKQQQDLQKIQADTDCANVYEYRYTEAVIDNFASLNEQKYWDGEGQRYWLNEEFWGGVGYPVFVFIGGEWVESCYRLTSSVSISSVFTPLFSPSLFLLFPSNTCINLLKNTRLSCWMWSIVSMV